MFEIGQRVICTNAKPTSAKRKTLGEIYPVEGQVYTIRETGRIPCNPHGEIEPGVHLEEIVNKPRGYVGGVAEVWFRASRFAPIKKTDISIFLEMLELVKEKV